MASTTATATTPTAVGLCRHGCVVVVAGRHRSVAGEPAGMVRHRGLRYRCRWWRIARRPIPSDPRHRRRAAGERNDENPERDLDAVPQRGGDHHTVLSLVRRADRRTSGVPPPLADLPPRPATRYRWREGCAGG